MISQLIALITRVCFLRTCLPDSCHILTTGDEGGEVPGTGKNFQVWAAATSAICGCLNNPQNGN